MPTINDNARRMAFTGSLLILIARIFISSEFSVPAYETASKACSANAAVSGGNGMYPRPDAKVWPVVRPHLTQSFKADDFFGSAYLL